MKQMRRLLSQISAEQESFNALPDHERAVQARVFQQAEMRNSVSLVSR